MCDDMIFRRSPEDAPKWALCWRRVDNAARSHGQRFCSASLLGMLPLPLRAACAAAGCSRCWR